MTNLKLVQIAAVTEFGPMDRNDWAAFCDAPEGTLIGFTGEYCVLQTPDGLFEIYDHDCQCWALQVTPR